MAEASGWAPVATEQAPDGAETITKNIEKQPEQPIETEQQGASGAGPSSGAAPAPPSEQQQEEEDPLEVAQREQEEKEHALAEALNIQPYDDAAMKSFYSDMKEVDRENQVNRILGAFKLNPYEMLGLRFGAAIPEEDIRRAYRQVSLAVHPDKCTHPRAKDAFEIIGHAQKELLNEEKRKNLDFLLGVAKEDVLKEWKKAAKHDAAARLAAVLDDAGKEGVVAAWEATDEFHEAWKLKARDVLAKAEWRRRKMTKRMKEEESRAKEEFKQEKEEAKVKREADKAWETGREERVGTWRNFMGSKSKRSKGGSAVLGGLKPPKSKTTDDDKSYVQRPVGEQYRPPQAKR